MCRKLDGAEAVTEKWRAGPVLLENTGQGEDTFLMKVIVLIGRSFFCLCEVQTETTFQPAVSVGHLGLEKDIEAPGPLGLRERAS